MRLFSLEIDFKLHLLFVPLLSKSKAKKIRMANNKERRIESVCGLCAMVYQPHRKATPYL